MRSPTTSKQQPLRIALWTSQILLAFAFGAAGTMKLTAPLADLATQMAWVADAPAWLPRFVGLSELAGAVGLILPSALRIAPALTPAAAGGLATIMALAMGMHGAMYGEWGALPVNATLMALSLFVLWGRALQAPIASRATAVPERQHA